MEKHIKLLGTLYIIFGALFMVGAVIIYLIVTTAGVISGDETAIFVTGIVGIVIGAFLFLVSIPGIIGGIGLLKHQQWAKVLILIIGIINLINFPIGTFLGIYTMWVLMNNQTEKIFEKQQQ
jgi:hypothetical protein